MHLRQGRYRRDDILEATSRCLGSRAKRIPYYRKCSDLYLYGGDPTIVNRTNKIQPTVDAQASFLYAPQSIKAWLTIPPREDTAEHYWRLDPAADNLTLAWHDSKTGKKFKWCVNWGLVYGATIMCILPRNRTDGSVDLCSSWVHPRDFGVWEDTQPDIDEQEAVSLTSYFTLPQVRRMLEYNPRRDRVLKNLTQGTLTQSGFEGMITVTPNESVYDIKPEFWKWYWQSFDYAPVYSQPFFQFTDTYAFDDDLGDYRVLTTTGDEVVWDRPMSYCGVPGLLPFVKVCADEHPQWFWGISLADRLARLQMWYSQKVDELDLLIGKVADPPIAATGVGQAYGEKMAQYKRRSGQLTLPPGATFQSFQPDVPPQFFEFIQGLGAELDEQAGHRPNMLGKEKGQGPRGGDAMNTALRVAGSQMLSKAYEIEISAQDVLQLLFAYQHRYESAYLLDEQGNRFLIAELPDDTRARIANHSSSPIFTQDSFEVGYALHRSGAITDEMLLNVSNIPQLERAKHDLRQLGFIKKLADKVVEAQQRAKRSGALTK